MADSYEMTINLVVLGKAQAGKSAAGNSLLGSSDFESRLSPSSVTTCCSLGHSGRILGLIRRNGCELALRVRVLDTPSYPHSALSKEQVRDTVRAALAQHFGEEGLHLALLVLRADLPLCPDESNDTLQLIQPGNRELLVLHDHIFPVEVDVNARKGEKRPRTFNNSDNMKWITAKTKTLSMNFWGPHGRISLQFYLLMRTRQKRLDTMRKHTCTVPQVPCCHF